MQNLKQNYGRTMLEMLGVLAIIGILTAVGLSMYKNAIYSYKANIILNDARMIAATVLQKETIVADAETYVISTAEYKPETSYDIRALEIKAKTTFAVEVKNVEEGVCKAILDKAGSNYSIEVQDTIFDGSNTNICKAENSVKFMFDLTGLCDPKCPTCCYGVCCASDQVCYDETHSCGPVCKDGEKPFGTGTVGGSICCPEETKSVCGKNCCEEESTCCGGKCCSSGECSDFETGECCGTDKNGVQLKGDREAKECVCPGGMSLTDGACECPDGQIYVNGVCTGIDCYESNTTVKCTSSNCDCYIAGKRCGTGCTETGFYCSKGMCSDICPSESVFKYNENPVARNQYYGCSAQGATEVGEYNCTKNGAVIHCFIQGENSYCGYGCKLNGECGYGSCKTNPCPTNWTFGLSPTGIDFGYGRVFACKSSDGIICGKTGRGYYCYDNGVLCASDCTDMTDDLSTCSYNMCATCGEGQKKVSCVKETEEDTTCIDGFKCENVCPANTTYDAKKGACVNESIGVTCSMKTGLRSYYCYNDEGICGNRCSLDGTNCSNGYCNPNDCPAGMDYKSFSNLGFCGKNGVYCTKDDSWYNCYLEAIGYCGTYCTDIYGAGCDECKGIECGNNGKVISYSDIGNKLACEYPDSLVCVYNGTCQIDHYTCGTGCKLDGSSCTSGVCLSSDCKTGEELTYNSTKAIYECVALGVLQCENGVCKFGANQCGTGCEDDGTLCTTGTCAASECKDNTVLKQITNQYYGCYSSTNGTSCYKHGSAYICYKNGKECGTGCMVDGTGCTSEGQTCVTTEET